MLTRHFDDNDDNNNNNTNDNNSDEEHADVPEFTSMLAEQQAMVRAGTPVAVAGHYMLVVSNNKLIKYKACLSCAGKALGCCFSKGFTKEDIVHSKRTGPTEVIVVERRASPKVAKKRVESGTRKSLCAACRKRKVKCVMHPRLLKCVGCVKKDSACLFEC